MSQPTRELSHVDESGNARMVDVSAKDVTARIAVASGRVRTTAEVIGLISGGGLPKGDALATARIAGVMGAKKTPELIPLCHQIALTKVDVEFELDDTAVRIEAAARTSDRTGVEMEALTAVTVAGLALHDMIKAVDPAATLDDVRLETKDGGKSGTWRRDEQPSDVERRGEQPSEVASRVERDAAEQDTADQDTAEQDTAEQDTAEQDTAEQSGSGRSGDRDRDEHGGGA